MKTDRPTNCWTYRQLDRQSNGQTDCWTDELLDRQTDGQTDNWTKQLVGQTFILEISGTDKTILKDEMQE